MVRRAVVNPGGLWQEMVVAWTCVAQLDSVSRAVAVCKVDKLNKKKPFWRTLMKEADGSSDLSSRDTSSRWSRMRSLLLWPWEGGGKNWCLPQWKKRTGQTLSHLVLLP